MTPESQRKMIETEALRVYKFAHDSYGKMESVTKQTLSPAERAVDEAFERKEG